MQVRIHDQTFDVSNDVDRILHPHHPDIQFWNAVNEGTWETDSFRAVDGFVKAGDTVLDLGCWAGPISLYAAAKGARVHAVDPDPAIMEIFRKNVGLNASLKDQVVAHELAITAEEGSVRLNARDGYGCSTSSVLERVGDQLSSVEARSMTLSRLAEENGIDTLDFIKIDIEGGEFDVLPTWGPTLERLGCPTLLLAFHIPFLNQSIYKQRFRFDAPAKIMMRMEALSKRMLFRRAITEKVARVFEALEMYPHVYLSDGTEVSPEDLRGSFDRLRSGSVVFTRSTWDRG